MTTTVSNKRAQTQDRLMDAAIALFATKGVLAASVEEICERAGFTRGAFYSNFDSKDELVLAVLQRQYAFILTGATKAIDSVPDEQIEPQTLDEIIQRALLIFQATHPMDEQWLLASSEIQLYVTRNPALREALQSVETHLTELLQEGIQAVIDRHGLKLKIGADQLILVLAGYQERLALQALLTGTALCEAEMATQLGRLVRALVDDI